MMVRNSVMLPLLAIALLGLSACGGKKPLPEAPPVETRPEAPMAPTEAPPQGETQTPVGTTIAPGSLADFVAQAGSDTVLFAYDSYELDDAARAILIRQAQWLARYPGVRVTVEGHADERGTREYNLALGDRRATSAKNFLAAQGVATARLATISYGKERPAVDGSDEAAFAQNRRAVSALTGAQ
nr:peptidoglycan-associated lipoprotein Pal [Sandarakinorhabdus sp.]